MPFHHKRLWCLAKHRPIVIWRFNISTVADDVNMFVSKQDIFCSLCFRRLPTLSRRQKKVLAENVDYVQSYVHKKKVRAQL